MHRRVAQERQKAFRQSREDRRIPGLGSTKFLFQGSLAGVTSRLQKEGKQMLSIDVDGGCFGSKTTAEAAQKIMALGSPTQPIIPVELSYDGYIGLEILR